MRVKLTVLMHARDSSLVQLTISHHHEPVSSLSLPPLQPASPAASSVTQSSSPPISKAALVNPFPEDPNRDSSDVSTAVNGAAHLASRPSQGAQGLNSAGADLPSMQTHQPSAQAGESKQSGLTGRLSSGSFSRALQMPLPWPLPSWRPSPAPPAPPPVLPPVSPPVKSSDMPQEPESAQVLEPALAAAAILDAAHATQAALAPRMFSPEAPPVPELSVSVSVPTSVPETDLASEASHTSESAPILESALDHATCDQLPLDQASSHPDAPPTDARLLAALQATSTGSKPADATDSCFEPPPLHSPSHIQLQPEQHAQQPYTIATDDKPVQAHPAGAELAGMKPEQKALLVKGLQLSRQAHQVLSPAHIIQSASSVMQYTVVITCLLVDASW